MRERIEKSRLDNKVNAQLHRWYSFYEWPERDVKDQLDILHMPPRSIPSSKPLIPAPQPR